LTPHTLTAPPTDRAYWRRLLRLAHPDGAGDHELFVWCQMLREYIAGDGLEDVRTNADTRRPPPHPTSGAGERVDFSAAQYEVFEDLTARAVGTAERVAPPYDGLLRLLASCYPASEADTTLYRSQHSGASYKQLAYVAHLAGMDASQRREWYRICEAVPLSQRHAGHLISELQQRAA
jgi:hypothetical protein